MPILLMPIHVFQNLRRHESMHSRRPHAICLLPQRIRDVDSNRLPRGRSRACILPAALDPGMGAPLVVQEEDTDDAQVRVRPDAHDIGLLRARARGTAE